MPETQELPLELVADFYSAYLRNYIERDARSFSLPQDVQTFWSFVRLLASLNAQEIVPAALAREWGVVAPTVACWLETLRATFQYQSIPAFSGNPVKRVTGKAKGLLREVGLGVHLLSLAGPASVADSPLRGHLFESMVVGEIRKATSMMATPPLLSH
jgi:predicted AAA+ superfamily ATPase